MEDLLLNANQRFVGSKNCEADPFTEIEGLQEFANRKSLDLSATRFYFSNNDFRSELFSGLIQQVAKFAVREIVSGAIYATFTEGLGSLFVGRNILDVTANIVSASFGFKCVVIRLILPTVLFFTVFTITHMLSKNIGLDLLCAGFTAYATYQFLKINSFASAFIKGLVLFVIVVDVGNKAYKGHLSHYTDWKIEQIAPDWGLTDDQETIVEDAQEEKFRDTTSLEVMRLPVCINTRNRNGEIDIHPETGKPRCNYFDLSYLLKALREKGSNPLNPPQIVMIKQGHVHFDPEFYHELEQTVLASKQ